MGPAQASLTQIGAPVGAPIFGLVLFVVAFTATTTVLAAA